MGKTRSGNPDCNILVALFSCDFCFAVWSGAWCRLWCATNLGSSWSIQPSRTGKAGAMLLGKQTKSRSETANQGLEKSRESVGWSPPISVLIFVYASVGKKKAVWISWSWVLFADNYNKASLISTSRPAENHCQLSSSNCLTIQLFCVSNHLQTDRSAEWRPGKGKAFVVTVAVWERPDTWSQSCGWLLPTSSSNCATAKSPLASLNISSSHRRGVLTPTPGSSGSESQHIFIPVCTTVDPSWRMHF